MPTPGSPPTSTSEAGTSPPPSTRSSSGTPVEMPLGLLGDDVDEAKRRPRQARRAGTPALSARGHGLGDQRPELAAAGAAPEPAAGRGAALGAHVLDGRRFRHRRGTVLAGPDGTCAAFGTIVAMRLQTARRQRPAGLGDQPRLVADLRRRRRRRPGARLRRRGVRRRHQLHRHGERLRARRGRGVPRRRARRRGRATPTCSRRSSTSRWTTPARTRASRASRC